MSALEAYRGREFIGVEELATAAASLVERYSPEPARGNVRLAVTPRIVRHYLSEELLGETSGQSGTSTVFNYGNLLRLLSVKKLLAEHWSVIKIKEFMTALDITALEQLVSGALASPARSDGGPHKKPEAASLRAAQRRPPDGVTNKASAPPPPLASLAVESARRAERTSMEWIELVTGLEIKVRRSFRPPRSEQEQERLVTRFRSVVNRNAARVKDERRNVNDE